MSVDALEIELEKTRIEQKEKSIKVVVWDLDHTIWDGVLLEDEAVTLRAGARELIEGLDERGILQSISSKNDPVTALAKLKAFGLDEYFLYPQIGWNAKSTSIAEIATAINVGLDTLAFIDDQAFEREEVAFNHPQVLCLDVTEINGLLDRNEFTPRFRTEDSRNRRRMYMSDIVRNSVEKEFEGPQDAFLATLQLKLTLGRATVDDLQRAEELTRRTNQLNTTGYTYSYDELKGFMDSDRHELLIAGLEDRFGTYGKIGLCLVERIGNAWVLKLLLMSCRVMSRGVGSVLITHLIREANRAGVHLLAEFVRTDRNRMMFITYRLAGFGVVEEVGGTTLLRHDCEVAGEFPSHVTVIVD